jgi:hypothetical protein
MTIKALYPNVRPSLDLNFARTRALDPRITFTRASTGTFVGSDGLIKAAASGAARFDHSPTTGESLGLLVEEARTNLIRQSIVRPDLPNDTYSFWTPIAGTVITANAATAPDGTLTAALVENNTTATADMLWRYEESLTNVSGLVDSIWLKSTGGTVTVAMYGSPTAQDAITNVTFGSTWTRLSMRRPASANYFLKILKPTTASVSFYAWGGQTEIGTFPTSYIPTSGATVTRSADVASITGTNFSSWYNQSAGTWLGQVSSAYATTQRLFEVGNSSDNQYSVSVRPGPTSTSFARQASGANGVNHSYPAKFAVADSVTDIQGCVNGTLASLVSTGNSVTDDKLVLGGVMSGTSSANSIARLTYWPTRLPDAQLQTLTQ